MQHYFIEVLEIESTETGEEAIFEKIMRFSRIEESQNYSHLNCAQNIEPIKKVALHIL